MSLAIFWKLCAIVLIAALGWIVGKLRWLGEADPARTLANAAYYIFVPALLFRTTARIDFETLDTTIVLAFFLPALVLLFIVYGFEKRRPVTADHGTAAPSVRAITAVFGNTLQVGIPVAAAVFGETGLAIHVTVVSLHALTLLTVLTLLVELDLARERRRTDPAGGRLGRMLLKTARNTIIHPVVLPVIAGISFNASGAVLPAVVDELLITLGAAVVPLCLVLIGMSLAYYGVQGAWQGAAALTVIKLLVLPAMALVSAHWIFGLHGLPLGVVVMLAALPVGSNALIFSQRYATLQAEASATTVFSTLAFVATCPFWLTVLGLFAP